MKPHILLAIVSGILVGTSYIPFPPWAIFFCFTPLWWAWLKARSYKRIFITGWITQFILTLIGFNWVSYTVHEFGHLPWPVAIIVLFLFCGFANLHYPLSGLVWHLFRRWLKLSPGAAIAALPVFMSAGERLYPMIFQWHFGYTWLWAGFPAFHLSDIFGFFGLSTIGLAFNAILLWGFTVYRQGRRTAAIQWLAAVPAIFLLLNIAGHLHGQRGVRADETLKIAIIQANVGNQEKLMSKSGWSFRDTVMERFTRLSREAVAKHPETQALIWPETAFPEIITDRELRFGFSAKLKELINETGRPLFTGSYSRTQKGRITNSFFALNADGHWSDVPYHKSVLLAFGEYFPGADLFPKVREMFPQVADFGRGPGPTVMNAFGGLRVGVQICYEGLFDWFTRDLANQGAQVIANVTNDSWYGTWMQPWQHLYMTLAKAVEVRLPLIRSTNTGISTVILADGTILEQSPLQEEWFYLYEVPYARAPNPTLFMGWGYWIMPAGLLIAFLIIAATGRNGYDYDHE